ncbi:MAG: hypothetical protein K8U03_06920 [Planctomycetia bacterium]|nr:hypothetical protein [Planctomycetia bacterium]
MYPHPIRLREPWESEPSGEGSTRHRRFFNTPTGLGPREQVWIVIEGAVGLTTVSLNGTELKAVESNDAAEQGPAWSSDVTRLVATRNELVIVTAAEPTGRRGEVRLEIRLCD